MGDIYDRSDYSETELLYIEYGRFCEHYGLDTDDLDNYESFLNCGNYNWDIDGIEFKNVKENLLYVFLKRLKTDEYKCILFDGRIAITNNEEDIETLRRFVYDEMLDNEVVISKDTLEVIYPNRPTLFLKGIYDMTDSEIEARKFISGCGDNIIVRENKPFDYLVEEDNFRDIDEFYGLVKDIIKVEKIDEDKEMNWDSIRVYFKDRIEIWETA
jgi:hypothetical protein